MLDKNDSPPVFYNLYHVFNVSEDSSPGQVVATVRAYDPDTIGKLEYSLVSGDDKKFSLNKNDGTLTLKDTLDREIKDHYKLVIKVTDGVQFSENILSIQVNNLLLI